MCVFLDHSTPEKSLKGELPPKDAKVKSMEPLIKSRLNQLNTKKWKDHFGKITKTAHFTGEVNSPYSRFFGALAGQEPAGRLIECFTICIIHLDRASELRYIYTYSNSRLKMLEFE